MFYRGVYHLVVDADACLSGALQNGTFRDETFEYLSAQKLHCWKLNVLAAQVNRHRVNALLKLMLRDDVIVDDGNDAVEFTGCRRACSPADGVAGTLSMMLAAWTEAPDNASAVSVKA